MILQHVLLAILGVEFLLLVLIADLWLCSGRDDIHGGG
jgi:hypothetical protein